MALSKRGASVRAIALFKAYAKAHGYTLLESKPYSGVHRVHANGSWHYDSETYAGKSQSLAVDVNWPVTKVEHAKLVALIPVARSMGLSIIFAQDKALDSVVAAHVNHMHVDCGSYSNLGGPRHGFTTPHGDLVVWDIQTAVHTAHSNLWDAMTDKRVNSVRYAAKGRFPYGRKFAQASVGTDPDGVWGKNSRAALTKTIKALQTIWKRAGFYSGKIDGVWGDGTESAWKRSRAKYKR